VNAKTPSQQIQQNIKSPTQRIARSEPRAATLAACGVMAHSLLLVGFIRLGMGQNPQMPWFLRQTGWDMCDHKSIPMLFQVT